MLKSFRSMLRRPYGSAVCGLLLRFVQTIRSCGLQQNCSQMLQEPHGSQINRKDQLSTPPFQYPPYPPPIAQTNIEYMYRFWIKFNVNLNQTASPWGEQQSTRSTYGQRSLQYRHRTVWEIWLLEAAARRPQYICDLSISRQRKGKFVFFNDTSRGHWFSDHRSLDVN